jgi:hypothetical protein
MVKKWKRVQNSETSNRLIGFHLRVKKSGIKSKTAAFLLNPFPSERNESKMEKNEKQSIKILQLIVYLFNSLGFSSQV